MRILEKLNFVHVQLLRSWHSALVLFVLGLVSGLAVPPVGAWWVLGLTVPLAFTILMHRRRFWFGWLFGFGYFVAVLHWIGFAFLVDANAYLWMMPFAVGGLAAGMALFWAAAISSSLALAQRGLPVLIIAPLCFAVFEWLRGHILTGFPWAVPGLVADGMGGTVQLASLIGMNGLTLLVVMWALAPLGLFIGQSKFSVLVLASLPLSWIWGNVHVAANKTEFMEGQVIRLVQPNISQSDKWRGDNARAIFDQLLEMSARPSAEKVSVIVWPESAVPFLIDESAEGLRELKAMLGGDKFLLTGAVRRQASAKGEPDYFTSVLAFDGNAKVIAQYDKKHLVPGGEYLPLAWLLEPLGFRKVVSLPESFTAGSGSSQLAISGLGVVSTQICYEAIFPEILVSSTRPDWILNVTNDGWFGNSAGPYQHLAQMRLRAIEQGVGVVRVANTGVSAIIDATGGYIHTSELGVEAVIDSKIPKAIGATFYSRFGDLVLLMLIGILGLAVFLLGLYNRSK